MSGVPTMELIVATLLLAVVIGYAAGGRISALADLKVRWGWVAIAGLVLQSIPMPSRTLSFVALYLSFALLLAFAAVNIGRQAIPFVAVNSGMPVTRDALVTSGQLETLDELTDQGWVKHHLAGSDDDLLFLGDAIGVSQIGQVVSIGDVFAYLGVAWLVVSGMRRRPRHDRVPVPLATERSP
jgi:Family of unknown function (DUF5317)